MNNSSDEKIMITFNINPKDFNMMLLVHEYHHVYKYMYIFLFILDPEVMPFELLKRPIFHYPPERPGAPDWLIEAEKKVKAADAYVIVSGEYNHSIPPALSNMMDHFGGSSYAYKPSGIVCYSPGDN